MFVCRLVREDDFEAVYELTRKVKSGLTTLLLGKEDLRERILESVKNVHYPPRTPNGETFFFVLEEVETAQIVGTSAAFSKVGGFKPFWTYQILESHKVCKRLGVDHKVPYLQVKRIHDGPSEIGSLFLQKEFRSGYNGRLLSLSRFLFMAQYSSMFEQKVVAEMRGRVALGGDSPFWDAIGGHFFGDVSFEQADLMSNLDKTFIEDLMPVHPIYIPLLPQKAQDVIGEVHPETEAAIHLLQSEGFRKNGFVDVFEAGPMVECDLNQIRSVRLSKESSLGDLGENLVDGELSLVANVDSLKNFAVTVGLVKEEGQSVSLDGLVAHSLDLEQNGRVRFVKLRGEA